MNSNAPGARPPQAILLALSADGLLIAPGTVAVQDGPAIEEVLFLRDEMANLVWAVERCVKGASGAARSRVRERDDPRPPSPGPVHRAQLDYLLQTRVPGRWIPYVPRTSGYRAIELVQGRMPGPDGGGPVSLGSLLNRPDCKVVKDAEVPREGIIVRRQPSMTRRADGGYERWTARRVAVGRGEGSSQLAFDSAIPHAGRYPTARHLVESHKCGGDRAAADSEARPGCGSRSQQLGRALPESRSAHPWEQDFHISEALTLLEVSAQLKT